MKADKYQEQASRTLIDMPHRRFSDEEIMLAWIALGLSGEVGELADYIKKGVFHDHGIAQSKVKEELGDILWYVAAIATKMHLSLSESRHRSCIASYGFPRCFARTHARKHIRTHARTHARARACVRSCLRACVRACVRACMPTCNAVQWRAMACNGVPRRALACNGAHWRSVPCSGG